MEAKCHCCAGSLQRVAEDWVQLSICKYSPGLRTAVHVHEAPSLFYLLAGDHRESRIAQEIDQAASTALCYSSSTVHSAHVGPRGMTALSISVSPEFGKGLSLLSTAGQLDSPAVHLYCMRILLGMQEAGQRIEGIVFDLIQECFGEDADERNSPWLKRARDRLHAEVDRPPSFSSLAIEAGVHPVYLSRAFKQCFGRTMSEYLQLLRLQKALRIMSQRESCPDLAQQAGYSDQSHMIRQTRRWLRATPGQIKQVLQGLV